MRNKIVLAGISILLASTGFAQAKKKHPATLPVTNSKASILAGEAVYQQYCISCHLPDGGGVENLNPSLTNAPYVNGDKAKLITTVLNGMSQQEINGERYNNAMPAFNYLTDQQVADVLTYVRNSFGNKKPAVKATEVSRIRAKLLK